MSLPLRDVYAEPTLADLMPSVLSSAGVAGETNRLDLTPVDHTVVLLVDGMGWELLQRNAKAAPYLTQVPGSPMRAGFPTTTAVSLASLGTGLPSGLHGITGYQSYVDEIEAPVNWLRWTLAGTAIDQRDDLVPETVQPHPTVFERGREAGLTVTTVVPNAFEGSGLTRAVLRGGNFVGVSAYGDLLAQVVAAVSAGDRSLVYCYIGEVDTLGHVYGPESAAWLAQLTVVDRFVEQLADALPTGTRLLVTADHGMVDASRVAASTSTTPRVSVRTSPSSPGNRGAATSTPTTSTGSSNAGATNSATTRGSAPATTRSRRACSDPIPIRRWPNGSATSWPSDAANRR